MRHWAVVALALVPAAAVLAQRPETFRTRVDGVRIDALVTTGNRPVTGLTKEDFEVRDNGVVQQIESAEMAGAISAVIAVDTSFSVVDRDKIAGLAKAGDLLVDAFRDTDRLSFLTFAEGFRLRVMETAGRDAVRTQLANLDVKRRDRDQSAVWDAVVASASLVVGTAGRPLVFLFSDGADNASWQFSAQPIDARWDKAAQRHTVESLVAAGVVVDVMLVPRNFTASAFDDSVYGQLVQDAAAQETGGRTFWAGDPDLSRKLDQRLTALRSGYVLTYTPRGVARDGSVHRLSVRLRSKKGTVEGRKEYIASSLGREH